MLLNERNWAAPVSYTAILLLFLSIVAYVSFAVFDVLNDPGVWDTDVLNEVGEMADASPPNDAISSRSFLFSSTSWACPDTNLW